MKRLGLTHIELVAIIAMIAFLAALLLRAYLVPDQTPRRSSCQENLKRIGVAFTMYSNESKGQKYPTMKYADGDDCDQFVAGEFFFQGDQLYPNYLTDPTVFTCPSDAKAISDWADGKYNCGHDPTGPICPCRFDDESYSYTGWLITLEDYVTPGADPAAPNGASLHRPFLTALTDLITRQRAASTKSEAQAIVDADIRLESGTRRDVWRLREGIERFLTTEVMSPARIPALQSIIPVLWDVVSVLAEDFSHIPGGGNVLYMDGHVEFQRYPGLEHPVNPTWAYLMGMQDELVP